jgi:hypothetical protein
MVAGPNGLDLKKIQMRVKFKICFKFGLKIKKIILGDRGRNVGEEAKAPACLAGSSLGLKISG